MATPTAENPMAFLNMARQFQKAACKVLDSVESEPTVGNHVPLSDPIYFLFFHAVELALKAFLVFHRQPVPKKGQKGHDIVALHARCQPFGLSLNDKDDPYGLQNVVHLLASGNENHGFRYFNPKSGGAIPDLFWTRDVVNALIGVVRERVDDNAPPGVAVKIQLFSASRRRSRPTRPGGEAIREDQAFELPRTDVGEVAAPLRARARGGRGGCRLRSP